MASMGLCSAAFPWARMATKSESDGDVGNWFSACPRCFDVLIESRNSSAPSRATQTSAVVMGSS